MSLFAGTKWEMQPRCDRCGEVDALCKCVPVAEVVFNPAKASVVVRTEKRKAGRIVTIVSGLHATPTERASLLTQVKQHCGAGGTTETDNLIIQGDHASRIAAWFRDLGCRVKA